MNHREYTQITNEWLEGKITDGLTRMSYLQLQSLSVHLRNRNLKKFGSNNSSQIIHKVPVDAIS